MNIMLICISFFLRSVMKAFTLLMKDYIKELSVDSMMRNDFQITSVGIYTD